MTDSRVCDRVLVSGTVQGVGFRMATQRRAEQLGVGGWVRNLPDGRVEAAFEGDRAAVDAAIAWCHDGPPAARVANVEVVPESPTGAIGFEIRR